MENLIKFELGKTVTTRAIHDAIPHYFIMHYLMRHATGDWGDLGKSDSKMNDDAVKSGEDRILSMYHTNYGKIYIITEWDRSATTVLFANEY